MHSTHSSKNVSDLDEQSPPAGEDKKQAIRPHILIAEDNEANITTLAEYLDATGYDVTVARDGKEAVQMTLAEHPDLVIMDIQMPKMNGLEATTTLRGIDDVDAVPIIALTALAMPGDRERCLDAGACDYLSKPIRLRTLKETIDRLLGLGEAAPIPA